MEMSINGAKILATFENVPLLGMVHITQTLIVSWLVMLIISAVCIWLGSGLKVTGISRKQAAAEMIVSSLINFVHGNMGTEFDRYIPLVGTIFVTSLVSNLISLVGIWSPTADLMTELGWALVVFVIITYHKIKASGIGGYLKGFLDPIFVMAPINVMAELFTPVSMACRHFGNILSGFYAKRMGVPIGRLICASNENNVLTDFIRTGTYDRNRPFYQTASPSMDILISSNLERLLSLLSGSDEEVRGYMQKLSETGKYTVSDRVLRAVQAEFSCGFCTDAQGAQTIGRTFRENRYLLDTHTAVACTVLGAYRSGTGDQTLTVVESTASPFKFCASVLDALGVTEHAPGTGVLGQLTAETGRPAPGPLASLAGKPVRFDQVTDRGDMRAVVTEFLR